MKKLSANKIRQLWIDFFREKNHLFIDSKPLVPQNDNSLLWINSGVATLKDYFTNKKIPPSNRLVSTQRALRTNDIENVGSTSRHHTLFEMLGNFSIGDYFKTEAIDFAYEFLIKWLELDPKKLLITYYDGDNLTFEKWKSLGIPEEKLIKGNKKTNFWDLGQGPCGPCTEIYFDRGEKFDTRGSELIKNEIENDRFIEIWNIVFSEFNNDGMQNYTPLKSKNIDTGAGFERIVSILQDGPTNYDTDLFLPIIAEIEKNTDFHYDINNYFLKKPSQTKINTSFRIISDHIRAITFAINDGVLPSNLHRGYIIRRLIRRAYWNGKKLGINQPFLYKLVKIVGKTLEYNFDIQKISNIILQEEENFAKTLEIGYNLLNAELKIAKNSIKSEIVFKLFETYGFPVELTQEILLENNIEFNLNTLKELQEKHSEISRVKITKGMGKVVNSLARVKNKISEFVGYESQKVDTIINFLANENEEITESSSENLSYAIFKKTPFYATAGGQKHDQGWIIQDNEKIEILKVFKDKFLNNIHVFRGKVYKNRPVFLKLNSENRRKLERNHSATHLLFAALRAEFGSEIKQLGSDNNENRLTFDFPFSHKPSQEKIKAVENRVNSYINQEINRQYLITDLKNAQKLNAIMTLEESEYMDPILLRLVIFPEITTDLCGGTHIKNTKLIEKFTIINCQSKGAGIYRIRAVTSWEKYTKFLENNIEAVKEKILNLENKIRKIDTTFAANLPNLPNLEEQFSQIKKIEEKLKNYYKQALKSNATLVKSELDLNKIIQINKVSFYLDLNFPIQNLKRTAATLREKNPKICFILAANLNNNQYLVVVSSAVVKSDLILYKILKTHDGLGGGNAKIAQGKIQKELKKENLIELLWENIQEF
ncbi:alanine--tRNA ligase [Mycoplasma flocculare]|uniref:Alanine--tRNA ligase n=1 Tax=Mesomycoplasma flocculare TaxID=2128 RepID=A0AAW9XB31_MESFC|nr:alanine--tRNA ligase [Mesomycoplasma flocculare]MXR05884.1 alanine--tRNA ligase [Mesomycoplasma flocculare]MXR39475.1 alanine--tRNA ligase [Mycoplasma sp. MF12]MXR56710.1 alanine--tRNA ligase [Mesomycoplasma flocculare]